MPESPSPVAVYLYASYLIKIQAGLHSSRRCHGQDRRSPETPPAEPRQRLIRTLQRERLYGRADGHARNEPDERPLAPRLPPPPGPGEPVQEPHERRVAVPEALLERLRVPGHASARKRRRRRKGYPWKNRKGAAKGARSIRRSGHTVIRPKWAPLPAVCTRTVCPRSCGVPLRRRRSPRRNGA